MCYLPSALTVFVVVCSRPSHCLPVTFPPSSVSGPSDCHSCVCLPDCVTCLPVYTPSPSVPGPSSSRSLLCAFIPGLVSSCPLFLSTPLGIGPRWFPARFVHSVQTCLLSALYWGPSCPEVGISGVIHRSQCRYHLSGCQECGVCGYPPRISISPVSLLPLCAILLRPLLSLKRAGPPGAATCQVPAAQPILTIRGSSEHQALVRLRALVSPALTEA